MLRIHAIEPRSRANGPGIRLVVWFQGCTLDCAGCFNPATHAAHPQREVEATTLVDEIVNYTGGEDGIEGVTFSGGEPFQQASGLLEVVKGLRDRTSLSILVFSGFTREEIERMPTGPETLALLDVLVDGRYEQSRRVAHSLLGSANQRVHLISKRYDRAAIDATPIAEIKLNSDGTITQTGVNPLDLD